MYKQKNKRSPKAGTRKAAAPDAPLVSHDGEGGGLVDRLMQTTIAKKGREVLHKLEGIPVVKKTEEAVAEFLDRHSSKAH